ncbi:MAG: hypothetical protein JO066_15390, partial [Verrucomicrobia bacterium]|nr:hypothetical protein [Verrucomicrobiota bacterium]
SALALGLESALALGLESALALGLESALELGLKSALELGLESALELGLGSPLGLVLASESELTQAVRTPAVYLRMAVLVRKSVAAQAVGVEPAQAGFAPVRRHPTLQAEVHHLYRLRTARFLVRSFAPEI